MTPLIGLWRWLWVIADLVKASIDMILMTAGAAVSLRMRGGLITRGSGINVPHGTLCLIGGSLTRCLLDLGGRHRALGNSVAAVGVVQSICLLQPANAAVFLENFLRCDLCLLVEKRGVGKNTLKVNRNLAV